MITIDQLHQAKEWSKEYRELLNERTKDIYNDYDRYTEILKELNEEFPMIVANNKEAHKIAAEWVNQMDKALIVSNEYHSLLLERTKHLIPGGLRYSEDFEAIRTEFEKENPEISKRFREALEIAHEWGKEERNKRFIAFRDQSLRLDTNN